MSSQNVAPVTNTTPSDYITFYTPGTYTGDVTNNSTLTPTGSYPATSPGSATGISVLESGTVLLGSIINTGAIDANQLGNVAGINIGEGRTANTSESNAGAVLSGSITNSGTITSNNVGIWVAGNSTLLSTVTGSIINAAGGQISFSNVGINVNFATLGGSITNAGTITGATGLNGINVAFANVGSTGSGNIVNATGAQIIAGYNGIVLNGNTKTSTINTTLAGSMINNGTITAPNQSTHAGLEVAAATVLGGLTNTGTINGGQGIVLFGATDQGGPSRIASVAGSIVNQGQINAVATNGSGGGIEIFGSSGGGPAIVGGSIVNSGTVSVTGISGTNDGILLAGARLAGDITNSSTISVSGGASNVGIAVANSGFANFAPANSSIGGSILNRGTIAAGTGILVSGDSTVAGSISNTSGGTITATLNGIMVTGGGVISGITNSGDLSGSSAAIDVTGEDAATTIDQMAGTVAGAILLSTLADTVDVTGGTINGNIVGQGSSNTLDFALGSGNTFTYGASFSFSGINQVNVNSGTVILDGTNSANGTSIAGGATLQLGSGDTTGSIALTGSFLDDGVFAVDRSDSYTFAGAISGSGAVEQLGAGTTVLTAADSVTGGTMIGAGTLELGKGGSVTAGVAFANAGVPATFQLDTGTNQLGGDINGFATADTIDLDFLSYSATDKAVWSQSGGGGTLTIENDGTTLAALDLTGSYTSSEFKLNESVNGSLDINLGTATPVANDFNGDAISDMLWRSTSGTLAEWLMNGSTITTSSLPTYQGDVVTPDSSWSIAAINDFNGAVSPNSDMLWRQAGTGSVAIWLMNGGTIQSSGYATYQGTAVSPDSTWNVVGSGDFNGDGNADLLWQQSTTGDLADWSMNGTNIQASAYVTYQGSAVTPDSSWSVAGTGDFDGDGKDDILWRQSSTSTLAEWDMSGSTITASGNVTYQGSAVTPNSTWSVIGTGDFNGDGNADVLWRQSGSGSLAMWLMNGSTIESSGNITYQGTAVAPDSTWKVLEVGDFNGSKDAGIVWQQTTTGDLIEWQMNGTQIVGQQAITSSGTQVAPNPSTWTSQASPTTA